MKNKKEPKLKYSIIIPVRTLNDFLKENIEHLRNLHYPNFEVLIVVDEPEDYDFRGDTRFKIIVSGRKGPGEKRNIGASGAKGDVLAFLDDDAYPSEEWLDKASESFKDPEIYALGAPAITPLDVGFLEKCSGRVLESWLSSGGTRYRHVPSTARLVNDYPTVNLLIRKSAFDSVGGLVTEFWPGEDTKLCLDLIKKYKRDFLYSPEPIVYHHRRELFVPHLKQISRYGTHRGQFARIFPETSRLPSYFVPSLFILGLLLGPVVCSLVPILWYIYFPVVALYLILLIIEGIHVYIKDRSLGESFYVVCGVFLTHVVYGINFILGFFRKPKLQLRAVDTKTGNYLGG